MGERAPENGRFPKAIEGEDKFKFLTHYTPSHVYFKDESHNNNDALFGTSYDGLSADLHFVIFIYERSQNSQSLQNPFQDRTCTWHSAPRRFTDMEMTVPDAALATNQHFVAAIGLYSNHRRSNDGAARSMLRQS